MRRRRKALLVSTPRMLGKMVAQQETADLGLSLAIFKDPGAGLEHPFDQAIIQERQPRFDPVRHADGVAIV